MKERNKSQGKPHATSSYNLQMIRDFLEHLLWEHRIFNFEHRTRDKTINPELVEVYDRFYKRYGISLIPRNMLKDDVNDSTLWAQAESAYHEGVRDSSQCAIDALEAAMPFVEAAFSYVQITGGNPFGAVLRRASQVLGIEAPVKSKLPEPFNQMPLHYLNELSDPDLQQVFKAADVVFGVDEKTGRFIPLFGDDHIQNGVDTGEEQVLCMLGFVIDAESIELEHLLVHTEMLKGSHCYPMK
ncbi:MAG: hypothetical protein WD768_23185 [Phycisphaeraceae bacterium]